MAKDADFCANCGNRTAQNDNMVETSPSQTISASDVPEETSKHLMHTGITDIVIGAIIAFQGFAGQREVAAINSNPWVTFLPGTPEIFMSGTHSWFVAFLGILIAGAGLTLIIYRNDKSIHAGMKLKKS